MNYTVTTNFLRETYAKGRAAEREVALAEIDAFLNSWGTAFAQDAVNQIIDSLPSTPEPGNPFMYDPWEDDCVDPGNLDEVVHAAVSRGWDAGKFDMIEHVKRSVEDYMEISWRNGKKEEA